MNHSTFFNTFLNAPTNPMTTSTNMSEANSLNTSSSLSAISSTPSRKLPPPHLEAIQTQKAQANSKFRPVSKMITGFIPPYTQDQLDELGLESPPPPNTGYSTNSGHSETLEPPMSAVTSTTAMDSVPYTPSTLVGGVLSPLEHHPEYPVQLQQLQQQQQLQQPVTALTRHSGSISRGHQDGTMTMNNNRASVSSNRRHSRGTNKNRYSSTGKQGGGLDFGYGTPSAQQTPALSEGTLPTLWQVLHRKTSPPVCLYNFYLYMRDSEKSSEELDFWLDVTAHEILWKIYVRANKRRQALAAQERAERDEKLALDAAAAAASAAIAAAEEEAARLEEEKMKIQRGEGETEGDATRQGRTSINLAVYEPHWSAANRYLEMTEGNATATATTSDSDHNPDYSPTNDVDMNYKKLRHKSSDLTQFENIQEIESPTTRQSLDSTVRNVPNLPGAVPPNWGYDGNESAVGRQQHQQSSNNKSTVDSLATKKDGSDGNGTSTTVQRSGTMAKSTTLKRGLTSGTSSVTKEDLQKSAEQIYYKYLTPQAEKPIRVPRSIKQRVALTMDSTLMPNNPVVSPHKVISHGNETTSNGKDEITAEKNSNNQSLSSITSPKDEKEKSGKTTARGNLGDAAQKQGLRQSTISQSSGPHPDQDIGLVFAEAREVVFEGMESYYFPRFLKARAYGNMVRSHRIARAILGLFFLFLGFVIALVMIFLNLRPRSLRGWAIIPMFIGIFLCTTFQFNICPFMVAFEVSETTWMQFAKIKEPYILTIHRKRAVKVVVVAILYTICVGTIFGLLPGHRL